MKTPRDHEADMLEEAVRLLAEKDNGEPSDVVEVSRYLRYRDAPYMLTFTMRRTMDDGAAYECQRMRNGDLVDRDGSNVTEWLKARGQNILCRGVEGGQLT